MEQKIKFLKVKGKNTTAIHLGSVGKATEERVFTLAFSTDRI